jgi:small subunit ribosomal protein S17
MAEPTDTPNEETDADAEPEAAAPAKKAAASKKAAATKAAATENGAEARERTARKVREGIVASTSMNKTAVIEITTRKPHPLYRKTMVRTSRLQAHDEQNELRVGDRVRVAETRPLSKTKRWRLVEILERAK